jgi:hypothetical protein
VLAGKLSGTIFARDTLVDKQINLSFNRKKNRIEGTLFLRQGMGVSPMVNALVLLAKRHRHHLVSHGVVSAIILLSGCVESRHLSIHPVRNAVYDIPNVGRIKFKDGAYDREANDSLGQSYAHIGLVDLFAFGDLNGDGLEDAVTFLASNFGGSGIFVSLEILLNNNGSPSHVASYLIGDRVGIDSVNIVGGLIELHIITQGPDDSMCCPTLHVSKQLRLQNGKLMELNNLKR